MAGPYSNLTAAPGVDLSGVRPQLLAIVNGVLRLLGKQGTVISGYRTPEHSVAVGGFANDPHTRGEALDVYVGGTPLGSVPGAVAALTAAGLISGAQPNFYHGQPDPAHVQIGGGSSGSTGAGTPSPAAGTSTRAASSAGCLPAALLSLTLMAGGVASFGWFMYELF